MSLASLQMPLGVPGYQYDSAAQMAEALAQLDAQGFDPRDLAGAGVTNA